MMDYYSFVASLANIMVIDSTSADFQIMLPNAIAYAEGRIYREIDLLNLTNVNSTQTFTKGNRFFTLPAAPYSNYLTVMNINVITPVGSTPDAGQRNQLQAVSMSYLDAVWNSSSGASVPRYFAMVQQDNMIVGPWPNAAYTVEVVGTYQPAPLSASNTTTFLTTYLPDLFLAGAMIFASGWQRDFGSQADNPQQSQSWEAQYETLFKSANLLELRKKWAGVGWTSLSSIPISPTR
jgi:hypothetical protein